MGEQQTPPTVNESLTTREAVDFLLHDPEFVRNLFYVHECRDSTASEPRFELKTTDRFDLLFSALRAGEDDWIFEQVRQLRSPVQVGALSVSGSEK